MHTRPLHHRCLMSLDMCFSIHQAKLFHVWQSGACFDSFFQRGNMHVTYEIRLVMCSLGFAKFILFHSWVGVSQAGRWFFTFEQNRNVKNPKQKVGRDLWLSTEIQNYRSVHFTCHANDIRHLHGIEFCTIKLPGTVCIFLAPQRPLLDVDRRRNLFGKKMNLFLVYISNANSTRDLSLTKRMLC